MKNEALVFIKPHATNQKSVDFVETFLKEKKIELISKGTLSSQEIDQQGIVDKHYSAIANAAVLKKPEELELSQEAIDNFENGFGASWEGSCKQDMVVNGAQLQSKMDGISGVELNKKLSASKQVKMAPGLYAAFLDDEGVYCINGFYLALREVFTAKGNQVIWYNVRFDAAEVSWSSFRQEVIGATNPADAKSGSLRSELYNRYFELGLPNQPSMSENGVHASAGPLEGLRERQVWLGIDIEKDQLTQALKDKGVNVDELLGNPKITLDGKSGPVFDLTEDIDSNKLVEIL